MIDEVTGLHYPESQENNNTMKVVILTDNEDGKRKVKVSVSSKHYKELERLKTVGGFLRFNMELFEENENRDKTDTTILLPFLHKIFANTRLIDSYFS